MIDSIKKNSKCGIFLKVDFEKAFDSFSWDFLDFAKKTMGFENKWRMWVRSCATTAIVFVLVNGSPSKEVHMKKRLCQRCPLLLLLFNSVVEVFSAMLFKVADLQPIKGIEVGSLEVNVTYLQYVDDMVIICDLDPIFLFNTQ